MTIYASSALSQSVLFDEEQGLILDLKIGLKDLQEMDRRLQDYEILKEVDKTKDERITNLEKKLVLTQKELDLERRENELNKRIIELKDMEIQIHKQSFQDMKEVADRAIKLAETSKPKTNWGLIGTVLIAVFTLGLVIGM